MLQYTTSRETDLRFLPTLAFFKGTHKMVSHNTKPSLNTTSNKPSSIFDLEKSRLGSGLQLSARVGEPHPGEKSREAGHTEKSYPEGKTTMRSLIDFFHNEGSAITRSPILREVPPRSPIPRDGPLLTKESNPKTRATLRSSIPRSTPHRKVGHIVLS